MDIRFKDAAYMLLILIAVEKEFNIEIKDSEVEFGEHKLFQYSSVKFDVRI
jgi:acyl carrier protein